MGKQQTKFYSWRLCLLGLLAVVSCFVMNFGVCLINFSANYNSDFMNLSAQGSAVDSDIEWMKIHSGGFSGKGENDKVHYINSPAQLAYMLHTITEAGQGNVANDYTGHTFILENDINLDNLYSAGQDKYVTPLWTPIEIGNVGRNQNFTFDGQGFSIIGMNIKYDVTQDEDVPAKVGFFAELYGGVVRNVTFKNPVITYNYTADSFSADDVNRPTAPVEIAVGVIAGEANGTYIENVTIENPSVTVNTDNVNGHNFYVGTAVGKMSFTTNIVKKDGVQVKETINTVTPKQWGLNTVNVLRTDVDSTGVCLKVNSGTRNGRTYGQGTNTYLGGLVGVNVSSKIINSTLRDFSLTPNFVPNEGESSVSGTYCVGGLVGFSTQIAMQKEQLVAAGVFNNLLIDVQMGDSSSVVDSGKYYAGSLVGRISSGGYYYNNIVIGEELGKSFSGQVYNSQIRLVNDVDCISTFVDGVDTYFLGEENVDYSGCRHSVDTNGVERFDFCTEHNGVRVDLDRSLSDSSIDNFADMKEMERYNFYFASTDSSEFEAYCTAYTEVQEGEAILTLDNFELMNYFKQEDGYMYHAVSPILKYEVGLTVDFIDLGNAEEEDYEMRIDAIYQFRAWQLDREKNEPILADYTGLNYTVSFLANSPFNSNAYWVELDANGGEKKVTEYVTGRTYQIILEPIPPECEGYTFRGWKIEGLEENSPAWTDFFNRGLIYNNEYGNGFYKFGIERITQEGRRFVAVWDRNSYTASFVVRQKGENDQVFATEKVVFGNPIKGPNANPDSTKGYSFVGWFLEENLPQENEDADANKQWVLGNQSNDLMPGSDIVLYSGWINNFTMLSHLLENDKNQMYFQNYQKYFTDSSGLMLYSAYTDALNAIEQNNTTYTEQLLNNLNTALEGLRFDPNKLLNLAAFDETQIQNSCPFLYNYEERMFYVNFKKTVKDYAESEELFDASDIDGGINYYNRLVELFEGLEYKVSDSVGLAGGTNATRVQNLINKYFDLQNQVTQLDVELYSKESLQELNDQKVEAEEIWSRETGVDLSDVEIYINRFDAALKNLKPADAVSSDKVDSGEEEVVVEDSVPQLPIQPILLALIVVSVLWGGTGVYIGFDIVYGKRRIARKVEAERVEQMLEDDDNYL